MSGVACIVIATANRHDLIRDRVLPSIIAQATTEEIMVVGEYELGTGYRYLAVPPLTNTTIDALVKRDVGTLATNADILIYLCDDHALAPGFLGSIWNHVRRLDWDVLVPQRMCLRDGQKIELNSGAQDGYCGGHCGVFRRHVIQTLPWSAGFHHRNWDFLMSVHQQQILGFHFKAPQDLLIEDLEPEREPWK